MRMNVPESVVQGECGRSMPGALSASFERPPCSRHSGSPSTPLAIEAWWEMCATSPRGKGRDATTQNDSGEMSTSRKHSRG